MRDRTWIMLMTVIMMTLVPGAVAIDVMIDDKVEPGDAGIEVDAEKNIVFIAPDAGPDANYTWDFGDGRTADGKTVTHRFREGGTFIVTLITINATGEHASTIKVGVVGTTELQNWSLLAVGLMMALAGVASAFGIGIAATSAMALSAEKDVKMTTILIPTALPFTQVIYAFVVSFFILSGLGITDGGVPPDVAMNSSMILGLLAIGLIVGVTGISAIPQGISAGGTLSAVGKREGAFAGGIVVSAMPEGVAILGFVIAILAMRGLGLM